MIFKERFTGSPDEFPAFVARMQDAVNASGKINEDRVAQMTTELQTAHEQITEARSAAAAADKRAENAEAIAKAAHDRKAASDHGEALRSLPQLVNIEKDPELRGRVNQESANLLMMGRSDLNLYLDKPVAEYAQRFRRLNDICLLADEMIRSTLPANKLRAYIDRGGIKSLPMYGAMQECWKGGARALDTATAGGASEWVPTLWSSERFDDVKEKLTLANQFRWIPMPQSPYTIPVNLWGMTAYKVPESLADDNVGDTAIPKSDPSSSNRTLTAVKIATLSDWSREIDQDSIIAILGLYNEAMDYAHATAMDTACASGQLTAAIDTVAIAATDARKLWNGIRYSGSLVGSTVDFGAGMTAELLTSMIGKAGKYADLSNGKFCTGYAGLARLLILKDAGGNLLYLTRDRAGEAATLFNGTVGVVMGYPLVIAGVYPQNMNSSGVVDGVGGSTKTGITFFNSSMFIGGHRQGLEVMTSEHSKFAYDQTEVRSVQRADFKAPIAASSTKPYAINGINLATF